MPFDMQHRDPVPDTNPLQIVALNLAIFITCTVVLYGIGVGLFAALGVSLLLGAILTVLIVTCGFLLVERRGAGAATQEQTARAHTALDREIWKWTEDAADDAWLATRVKAKVTAELARTTPDARKSGAGRKSR